MQSQVRIIGGKWRGRKLPVVDVEGLRPTPDRVRETLFNWLAGDCHGACVLDCCAGSGALGFEAMSRGAAALLMVESDRRALCALAASARRLGGEGIEVVGGDALAVIPGSKRRFDLVFVDPPYAAAGLRDQLLACLLERGQLADGAMIYLEWPLDEAFELPTPELRWRRRKQAGRIAFGLAEWRPPS